MKKKLPIEQNRNIKPLFCRVYRGSLEDGLDNVSEYLGLDPANTLFLHTTVVNDNDTSRKLARKPSFAHSEILAYSSRKTVPSSKGICLYVNKDLRKYLNDTGISPECSTLIVNKLPQPDRYPYLSVSAHFKEHLLKNPELIEKFRGRNIVTSYLSRDDADIAEILQGKLIANPLTQSVFNSKYHFRKMHEKYGFTMPIGLCFKGLINLSKNILILKTKLKDLPQNENFKIWLKFESQTNGEGSMTIYDLSPESIELIRNHVFAFSDSLGISTHETMASLPLILELDASSMTNGVEIANIGVQAVVGDMGITLTGSTSQISSNGKYIGSMLSKETELMSYHAEKAALPAFEAMFREGYKGYMTIDVILINNLITGQICGYNIDPNARFTAGTPLLSLVHHSRKLSGRMLYGFSYSNAVRASSDVFQRIKEYAGDNLYKGEESDFEGIIPTILNDKKNIADNKFYLRTVVISDSVKKAENIYFKFKKRLIKDLKQPI